MIDFVIIIISVCIGGAVGWRAREIHAQRIVNRYFKNAEEQNQSPQNILNIEVLKENDYFYVYNTDNGAFITQVKTKEELLSYLKDKYPEKNVMVKKEHFTLFENT